MHLAIAICSIVVAVKWADWRHWEKYYPTLLYVLAMSMMYEFLTKEFTMWRFKPDFLLCNTVVVMVHAIVSVPLTVFVFLSQFPKTWGKVIVYYLSWIGIYIGIEAILYLSTRISYEHTWNLGWSLVFDLIMFPMLRLHYRKPLVADFLSIFIVVGYLWFFQVPIK